MSFVDLIAASSLPLALLSFFLRQLINPSGQIFGYLSEYFYSTVPSIALYSQSIHQQLVATSCFNLEPFSSPDPAYLQVFIAISHGHHPPALLSRKLFFLGFLIKSLG